MLITEADLLKIADAYSQATGASDTTIGSRVFDDGKKLAAIRTGGTISLRRANQALSWFASNWPEGAVWPADVNLPLRLGADSQGASEIGAEAQPDAGGQASAVIPDAPAAADAVNGGVA